ncbi:hypothetical protein [Paenibacillus sp. SN-8-1]
MIAYGCIGILFLFVLIRTILYYYHRKHPFPQEEIDRQVLSIINDRRERS